MIEELELPFSKEHLFERVRAFLALHGGKHGIGPGVPLRIGRWVPHRLAPDGSPLAYHVNVLIDPRLGVP